MSSGTSPPAAFICHLRQPCRRANHRRESGLGPVRLKSGSREKEGDDREEAVVVDDRVVSDSCDRHAWYRTRRGQWSWRWWIPRRLRWPSWLRRPSRSPRVRWPPRCVPRAPWRCRGAGVRLLWRVSVLSVRLRHGAVPRLLVLLPELGGLLPERRHLPRRMGPGTGWVSSGRLATTIRRNGGRTRGPACWCDEY